jgi:hypothetical protein
MSYSVVDWLMQQAAAAASVVSLTPTCSAACSTAQDRRRWPWPRLATRARGRCRSCCILCHNPVLRNPLMLEPAFLDLLSWTDEAWLPSRLSVCLPPWLLA